MVTDYRKQSELIDAESVSIPIHIIGCGALGSWLAFFLFKMGFSHITVYDYDKVEEHNLPNQFFSPDDIGIHKVKAMEDYIKENYDEYDQNRIKFRVAKITKDHAKKMDGVVFSCVDSMSARKMLYENCVKLAGVDLFIEARIGLFGAYVFSLPHYKPEIGEKYEATLYDDEEAEVSACGISQTALPAAVNCASIMIMQFISFLRGNELYNAIRYQMPDLYTINEKW